MELEEYLENISYLKGEINLLLNEDDMSKEEWDKYYKIKGDISRISSWLKSRNKSPYSNIEITFPKPTKFSVRAKSEKFERELKGDMYFEVVGGNKTLGYLDIKTRSFPDTLAIRLVFNNNLKIQQETYYDVFLVYDRNGNFISPNVKKSEEKNIPLIIRKLR